MHRTTIRLPEDLLRKAKRAAADSDVTLTALIEDALRELLARRAAPRTKKRALVLPVFTGAGLQPGVDLDDSRGLLEIMDRVS